MLSYVFSRLSGYFMMDIIFSTAFGLDIDSKNNPQNEIVKHGTEIVSNFYTAPAWRMDATCTYTSTER